MKEFTVYPIGSIEGEEGAQFIQLALHGRLFLAQTADILLQNLTTQTPLTIEHGAQNSKKDGRRQHPAQPASQYISAADNKG